MKRYVEILADVSDAVSGHFHHGEILYDEGVSSRLLYLKHLAVCLFKLIIEQDCVEGDEYLRPVFMCMTAQLPDVIDGVSGSLSCSEPRSGYIHSIGTAVDCRDADICVSCRSKQFKLSH